MLDGWQRASCGCVPSSSGATTMAEAGVIEGNVVVDSGAVGMTLSIVAVTAGEAGGGAVVSGGGCVVLGWSFARSASRCRIRSISAVIAASSDLYEKVAVSPSRVGGDRVRLVGASTPSSRWSTTAAVGSCRKFLVGISCRLDRLHKLCRLLPHASDFEECDTNEQREGPEKVSGDGKHQEVVQSTVEVAMVTMASIGAPTGDARSHSTGKLIFRTV